MELVNQYRCFDGEQRRYQHYSDTLKCDMHFSVFLPPDFNTMHEASVLYWLSGLTCTDENFVTKAGAQRVAAQLGMVLICPDTSPRGEQVADDDAYDLGQGAGFYVNALEEPWSDHFHMYDYIQTELPCVTKEMFPSAGHWGIAGHSMGGHGALTLALRHPDQFSSCSAFAPIVNPTDCPWGTKALGAYLGRDRDLWNTHDACHLLSMSERMTMPLRIDQGLADAFLDEQKLTRPLETEVESKWPDAEFHYHEGYDHSYFFIASFIEAHLRFHYLHCKPR